ncbi:hypothetical protein [Deinococcus apachensis]|uniref:hypothetical protein n=1 Tax=Deinococcus apachensis TaxID=309886 RepID=UPI00036C132F|nr:hypothetical protein [Deinococcus apachensis]
MRRAGLAALLTLLGATLAARAPSAQLSLRPSFGGAVLEGRIVAGPGDELTGVWSEGGHARLLKCSPRCAVVPAVPVPGTLLVGTGTPYRVVVSGAFRTGQRVKLALRFRDMQILNVDAVVIRP